MKSDSGQVRRLHPASMLFFCAKGLKEMYGFLPLIPVIVLWGPRMTGFEISRFWLTVVAVGLALLLLGLTCWLRWSRFGYETEASAIRIQHGVWTRQEIWIQRERIQSVDTTQNVAERLFGLVRLRIETAGGGDKPEAVLPSLSAAEAQRIQRLLGFAEEEQAIGAAGSNGLASVLAEEPPADGAAGRIASNSAEFVAGTAHAKQADGAEATAASGRPGGPASEPASGAATAFREPGAFAALSLEPGMLWKYAFTSYKTGVAFLLIAGLASRAANEWFKELDLWGLLESWFGSSWLLISLPIVFVLSWAITALQLFNANYGFRIERRGTKLNVERGLLEKKRQTIDTERIQALQLVQSMLHRPFGWYSVRACIAGNLDEKDKNFVLFPIVRREEAQEFLQQFTPSFRIPKTWSTLGRSVWPAYVGVPVLIGALVAAPGVIWLPGPYRWLCLLLPLLALLLGALEQRNAAWSSLEGQVAIRDGSLLQVQTLIPKQRVQWRRMSQSWLQQRRSRANLRISLTAGKNEQSFRLRHAPAEAVERLMREAAPYRGRHL
ncbi:PH domain-containing protein [Paenibacillus pasadenensis]|uniref:PH domain-containing protein n=1 Tax=Paenibacillus pasadenensis TaxID=217090 RepID=UPI00203BE8C5|nr:PH domain-containing protein [Paenibacillus pasadenensis]MCM3749428.1 PH domain-containing protein [Paenibacillus pasadenensis]